MIKSPEINIKSKEVWDSRSLNSLIKVLVVFGSLYSMINKTRVVHFSVSARYSNEVNSPKVCFLHKNISEKSAATPPLLLSDLKTFKMLKFSDDASISVKLPLESSQVSVKVICPAYDL